MVENGCVSGDREFDGFQVQVYRLFVIYGFFYIESFNEQGQLLGSVFVRYLLLGSGDCL